MSGVGNETEVGFVIFIQRCGDANNNRIHGRELRIVGGRGKALSLGRLDLLGRDAINVGTAFGERVHLSRVDVEPGDPKFLFAVQQGQRQSDIAKSNNADAGLALLNLALELFDGRVCGRVSRHERSWNKEIEGIPILACGSGQLWSAGVTKGTSNPIWERV